MTVELFDRELIEFLAEVFPKGGAARIFDTILLTEMTTIKNKAVKEIKNYHLVHPVDAAHDLEHHKEVVKNALNIVKQEGLNGANIDALEVAAWAHDIERSDLASNNKVVRGILENSDASEDFIIKVLDIINTHSFGNKQQGFEAKVLYDADKIEYVSLQRANAALVAVKNGSMSKEKLNGYLEDWKNRIHDVRKSMHFESSRKIFDKKFMETALHFKTDTQLSFMYDTWYNLYQPNG